VGSGKFTTPFANFVSFDGGLQCPDSPLPEDGNHPIIHLKENHMVPVFWSQLNELSRDPCSVAECVGTVYYKKLLLFARWNAQKVREMVLAVVQPQNTVTLIKPDPVFGTKYMTAPFGWVVRRC
jgi:hypothetical protein